MYKLTGVLLGLMLCNWALANERDDRATRIADSRAVAEAFGAELRGALQAAMQRGGPVAAIEVCQQEAPRIAARLGAEHGWEVGRTTDRLRNPRNAPDAWERAVLEKFARRAARGEAAGELEHAEFTERDGEPVFRYMRGIGVQEACLTCHGEAVQAPVAQALERLYPEDKARGYRAGQLRGAFTIVQPRE